MQINFTITPSNFDWYYEKANRYLPVRLSTFSFNYYGECIVLFANRADENFTDIIENEKTEIFVTLMDNRLYEQLKAKVLNMDYWAPQNHYNTCNGYVDGIPRKIHLDGNVF